MRKKNVIRLWIAILLTMALLIQPASVQANGEPDITVNPIAIDFGTIVEVYSSSPPETVTITNNGTADLNIGTIYISGANAELFSKQNDNCSEQTLAPGNSADLEVVFSPDTTAPCSTTLSIPSNDPDESLINVSLSGVATASSYTDLPICTEDQDQQNPAIYWDRIVWAHQADYNWDIHMYDLTADEEIPVCSESGTQKNPAIWGDRIVWEDYRNGNADIYMYDLATGDETPICTEASKQEEPAIWGDHIVWMDYRNGNRDIYMYDLVTENEIPICIEASNQWHPAIWGDLIVWEDYRNTCLVDGNADIYLYDLDTSGVTQITTDLRDQGNPAICGDRIVWEDDRNGNRDIYMYDLVGGELTAVCTEIHTQDNPSVSGEAIVWEDSRGTEEDIYLYELATGAEIPLCTAPNRQWTPAISGHRVVWEDMRNASLYSSEGDIYSSAWVRPAGADLSISMTELTDPVEAGYYLTYVLDVTNYGPGSASNVIVSDSLPAGVELISATTSQGVCTHVGDLVTGDIGSVPAGATVTLNIVVRPASAGVVTNEATVVADEADFFDYNNTATESTRVSEYGIVRAAGRWGTCIATIGSTPVYYSYRLGAWHPSLAAGPDGEVHLSYTREGWGIDHIANDVYVYGFDDIYYTSTDSAWFHKQQIYQGYGITNTAVIGGSWSRWEGKWSVMATDDAGNLHIAYVKHDSTGSAYEPVIDSYYYLRYINNVGGTWNQSETVAEFIEVEDGIYGVRGGFWDLSLALDSSGSAHITYIDAERGPCNAPLIYVNNQSGNWVSQTLTQGYRANQSAAMALDSNDHLHIAVYYFDYGGMDGLFYLTNAPAGAWQTPEHVDSNWSHGEIEGMYTDIAVDDDDNPHISYVSGGGESRDDTYYATRVGGVWSCTEVDTGDIQSACNSIAVDSSGEAHIAYYHLPTDELRYATSANAWQPETIDDEIPLEWGEYFYWNDIAVDSQDKVHIVYSKDDFIYEATRGTLAGQDIDHDGAVNEEEQGPDGLNPAYDGNSDGTADYEQGNAVSLHTADGTYYVTVASDSGTLLSDFQTLVNPSPGEAPAGAGFPFGFFDFMIYGLEPGAATTVDIYLPAGSNIEAYYKYGATSDDLSPHWYDFLYDGETGAEINGDVVTLHLVDGGRGDGDVTANGVIWEPGGPSSGSANTPPTAPEVDVTPDSPLTGDNLLCTVTTPSTDPDGDPITYSYAWYKDDVLQPGLTTNAVPAASTAAGETWKCVVTPYDGTDSGATGEDQATIAGPAYVPPPPPPPPLPTDENGVFTETYSITSEGGKVEFTVNEGTTGLTAEGEPLSEITITEMEDPPDPPEGANVIGLTYDLGPDGATFDHLPPPPATLSFTYDPADIPEEVNETDLVIAVWDADIGEWLELVCTVDPINHIITAEVYGFSAFTIMTFPPAVTTSGFDIVGTNSARLSGSLADMGTASSVDVSFEWGETQGGPYPNETTPQSMSSTGDLDFNLSGLEPGTTHYFRAKAVGAGTVYGVEMDLVLPAVPPSVTTNDARDITEDSVTLHASLDDLGTATLARVSFEWGENQGGPYPNQTKSEIAYTTRAFSFTLVNLEPDKTYYYRAVVVSISTVYGDEKSFEIPVPPPPPPSPPAFSLSNLAISPERIIAGESITISIRVSNTGGQEGTHTVTLNIDGMIEEVKEVALAAGDIQTISFTVSKDTTGDYQVTLDGQIGTFEVLPIPVAVNWPLIGGVIGAIAVILTAIFLVTRRRRLVTN